MSKCNIHSCRTGIGAEYLLTANPSRIPTLSGLPMMALKPPTLTNMMSADFKPLSIRNSIALQARNLSSTIAHIKEASEIPAEISTAHNVSGLFREDAIAIKIINDAVEMWGSRCQFVSLFILRW